MGNRAVIAFDDEHREKDQCPAIYLHWNGSRSTVEGFLKAAKEFGIRGDDPAYCIARLTQVIGNAIGGTLSLGVGCYGNFGDPGDNGVYWIRNWEIVEHDTDYASEYSEEGVNQAYNETVHANEGFHEVGAKQQ